MLQTLSYFFDELYRNFRITDAIDIAIISVMLYSGLVWFKGTASRRVATGVTLVVIVYFLARAFDLYLTSMLFQAGFAVLVIMLIVIFQEDLRRGFEQVATWGTLPSQRRTTAQITDIDTLVEVVYTLAASRRGALIVVKGREALDRHISNGVSLSGHLSKPLLLSIFDPHSPGHDGAVVLDDGRVAAFGAHLPLSKNREEIAFRGTRHSAALGLSERSDALVIAISEERGSVSTAERGALQEVLSAAVLKRRLERFFKHRFPSHSVPLWQRFLAHNMLLKVVAIILACTGWVLFAYNVGTIQQTFEVPIEYRNVPEHLSLDGTAPNKAQVTLTGSERAYRFLDPSSLKISVDLGIGFAGSQIIQITGRNLKLPSNLDVHRIQPQVLWINLREITHTKPEGLGPRVGS
jgi:diadenylate cyclase